MRTARRRRFAATPQDLKKAAVVIPQKKRGHDGPLRFADRDVDLPPDYGCCLSPIRVRGERTRP
jgi:hypothetical protein